MKTATIRRITSVPRYPCAADRRYYMRKLLDGLLAAATGVGTFVTILFFLFL